MKKTQWTLGPLKESLSDIKMIDLGHYNTVGFKTLRGYISWLKKTNKNYKANGYSGEFTIRLPIKY